MNRTSTAARTGRTSRRSHRKKRTMTRTGPPFFVAILFLMVLVVSSASYADSQWDSDFEADGSTSGGGGGGGIPCPKSERPF